MKEDKHTDRIIREKLASYSARPEHLTFGKVHENYLRRKKRGYRAIFITTAVVLLSLAGLTIAGYFLFPSGKNELSATKAMSSASTAANSVSTTSHEENPRAEQTTRTAKTIQSHPDHSETVRSTSLKEENSRPAENKINTSFRRSDNSAETKNKQDKLAANPAAAKAKKTNESAEAENAPSAASIKISTKKKNAQKNQSDNKTNSSQSAAISFSRKKEKKVKTESVASSDKAFNASASNPKNIPEEKEVKESPQETSPAADKGVQTAGVAETFEKETGSSVPENKGNSIATMKEEPATFEEMAARDAQVSDTLHLSATEPDILLEAESLLTITENAAATSPNPLKNHYFLLSPEVSWNSYSFKTSANSLAGGADSASAMHKTNIDRSRSFSGGIHFGYKYKNVGLSTGLQFYSAESQVSTNAFARNEAIFSKQVQVIPLVATTVIVTSTVIPPPISDTLKPPKVITSTVVYTAAISRTVTTNANTGTRSYVIVNGDTVSPQTYLNQIRFFTVPFYVNYTFNVWRKKLMIEPQAGVQLGIPIKSYQLVAEENRQFSYIRSKSPLKNYFFLLDASVKINYRLNRNMIVYFKQGYFMSTKSIYSTGYPIKNTLSNFYSSVGLSFPID